MRWPVAWVAMLALGSSGCSVLDPRPARDEAEVVTTAPGLAAAVLDHVDRATVTGVDATGADGFLLASVNLSGPEVASIVVTVVADRRAASTGCGGDDGYVSVECTTTPHLRELVAREPGCGGPALLGRHDDDARGNVLVQAFGQDTPAARALVLDLLDDELIGLVGSAETELAGRELDVDESSLVIEAQLAEVGQSGRC
jgi:hypothetical protein